VAEGEYLYPLPGEAAFSGFSLWQGEDELRGEMMDRDRARAIYEEIVRRRADPALIELAGHGLLRARVFPIEPGQERKVQLRYTQLLGASGEALHFRYAGGIQGSQPRPMRVDRDAHRRREEPALTDFELVVEDGEAYLDPFSPTHALERQRRNGRLIVRLEEELAGELSVFLPLANSAVGLTVASHHPAGEDGYVMLTLTPGRMNSVAEPRDVTAVVDVSGSMAGEKMAQARAALHTLLASLEPEDRFRLIAFSNSVRVQREGWQAADEAALREASTWVERLDADGGTNISGALAMVRTPTVSRSRPRSPDPWRKRTTIRAYRAVGAPAASSPTT
jgi:Ca-activated chloride channel family protein